MTQMLSQLAQRRAKPVMLGVIAFLVAITGIVIVFVQDHGIAHAQGNQYYVNCSAGSNGDGSQGNPWNSVNSVNAHGNFNGGDTIYFNRGTTCSGSLQPQGSGSSSSAPITIDAYGSGAQPIIDGGTSNSATFYLNNQQYWTIQNLEIRGGTQNGIYITGDIPSTPTTLDYFHLNNLTVHDVNPTLSAPQDVNYGLISIFAHGSGDVNNLIMNDIVLNNVQGYSTGQFSGLRIGSGGNSQRRYTNVTVENSTVHDTAGDGLVLLGVANGLMQNDVVYNNGKNGNFSQCGNCYTPVSLWNYQSNGVTAQGNEVYNDSYLSTFDGGAFDVDGFNTNSLYQYNYGHDNNGYCISMLSDSSNIFRYNICANNGRYNGTGGTMSDYFIKGGGQVYNNTSYWNPTANNPAILQGSSLDGSSFFKNNIIYAATSNFLNTGSNTGLILNNNLYWSTNSGNPSWSYGGTTYNGFSAYQSGSGQDAQGHYTDPKLNNPTYHAIGKPTSAFTLQAGSPAIGAGTLISNNGGRDFFGNTVSATCSPNIGADNTGAPTSCSGGTTATLNDNDGSLSGIYQGSGWVHDAGRNLGDYQNDEHWTPNSGDYFSYQFTGTGISWIGEKNNAGATDEVYLDGTDLGSVSTYTANREVQQVLFGVQGLSSTTHTLKVVKTTSGTNTYLEVDAFVVYTSPTLVNDNDGGLSGIYQGSGWVHDTGRNLGDYQNDEHWTATSGNYFSYQFTGTGISWIGEKNNGGTTDEVYLDGTDLGSVNTYTANREAQQVLFGVQGLSSTTHTLKVVKTTSGTSTFLEVDAFLLTN